MGISDEETRLLYEKIGSLTARVEESRKQNKELFDLIHGLKSDVAEVRVDVAEYRQEFCDHSDREASLIEWINDYRANKNKALGILATLGVMAALLGVALSEWIKRLMN